tara:strand:+ start:10250 stop:11113 length:864 start_codon:yes stop_codon:yes gene_type:complete
MKYNSTINNVKCLEWDLTLSQAFLLDLLTYAPHWAQTEKLDGIDYYWVSRNKVLDEIPNAFKTADTVYRALKELHQKGVIEHQKLGRKDMVRFTEKGREWVFKTEPMPDTKLGNKSELCQKSEKNPSKLGNKSEKQPQNSEINPTDNTTNSNKGTNDKKDSPEFKPMDYPIPDFVNAEAWTAYIQMRVDKKKAPTEYALGLLVKKLRKWYDDGWNVDETIENSAISNYPNIYDPKNKRIQPQQTNYQGNNNAINQSANSQPNHFDQLRAEARAKYGNPQPSEPRTVN